jgi:hypothetical protein
MTRRITLLIALAAAVVAAVLTGPAGAAAPAGSAALREFDGTVVSKNRAARSFRLRDDESGTFRIYVNRNTRFERIAGFAGLKVGAKNIEARARKRNGRWIAVVVERSGRNDNRRGDDDRRSGDDDRRGDDDRGGDDN